MTFHDADNYGAVLQAYALQETVKKIEKDVNIINYKQPFIIKGYRIIKINTRNVKSFAKSLVFTLAHLYNRSIRKRKFSTFRRKYLELSEPIWKSIEIKGWDAYIVGSDQIWNGNNTLYDKTFFLSFCLKNKKRIAYAASIGKDIRTEKDRGFIEKNIHHIDYISVREDSAKEILRNFTDKEIIHVLDPSLLADRSIWDELIYEHREIYKRKYLFLYNIPRNEEIFRIANHISKKLNLPVIYMNNSIRNNPYGFRKIKGAGPEEFLTFIKNASFVVTNSFHCTAFSIVFNRNFITLPTNRSTTRMSSLLALLKLENRLIRDFNEIKDDYQTEIDYTIPNELLKEEKEKSFSFLRQSLEG